MAYTYTSNSSDGLLRIRNSPKTGQFSFGTSNTPRIWSVLSSSRLNSISPVSAFVYETRPLVLHRLFNTESRISKILVIWFPIWLMLSEKSIVSVRFKGIRGSNSQFISSCGGNGKKPKLFMDFFHDFPTIASWTSKKWSIIETFHI